MSHDRPRASYTPPRLVLLGGIPQVVLGGTSKGKVSGPAEGASVENCPSGQIKDGVCTGMA